MSQTALGGLATWAIAPSSKVDVPDLPAIDPQQIQATTIANNTAAVPGLERLGAQINDFNSKQQLSILMRAWEAMAPGQLQQAQGISASQLRGEVPTDVQAQIQRQSVAGAYGRGYGPGSTIGQNDYLRNFGLTSMGIQQQGLANFGALANMAPKTPLFDMTSMFFTPQQRLAAAFQDRQEQFNINLMKAQIAAAPDPNMANIAQGIDSDIKMVEQAALSYAGGGMGGGQQQPAQGGGGSGGGNGTPGYLGTGSSGSQYYSVPTFKS
jgi:hypothetical protein